MMLMWMLALFVSSSFQNELVLPMNNCNLDFNVARDYIYRKTEGLNQYYQEVKDEHVVYEHVKGGLIRRVILRDIELFNDKEEREPGFRRLVRYDHFGNSDIVVIDGVLDVLITERAFLFTYGRMYNLMAVEAALVDSLKHCDLSTAEFVRKLVYSRLPKIRSLENYNGLGLVNNAFKMMDIGDDYEDHIKFHFNNILKLMEVRIVKLDN
ncbi:conserved hypothetical protein [Theileria orientalis strain Shintoku]|uniref:Uncharacterized protein n=1 Tax=Theileria orientalis strain Shintoku TaxID=869250 RepID=J4C3U0_THEOR|nr:conserved hypothetical protein [Theileria orientalis strain Shintoku]PVC50634.1 hypothetical protein MACL_00002131 [Theileria orientalis]BAM41026.1 conserved hypothetical protein [Theileria orientalis strain Shintoku]|eukprot:XP_009691327.1 conserved hypothetical protein [Theileria orientalis strain Shintoku]